MTKQEAAKIVYTIHAVYPRYFVGFSKRQMENMIDAWAVTLEDYTYPQASAGLKIFLTGDAKGFPPSPGQVIDCILKVSETPELSEEEAWGYVSMAICNGFYGAEEEFKKLPDVCKKVVGSPRNLRTWATMNSNDLHTIQKSHFIRAYRTELERRKDDAKIPASVKALIGKTAESIEDHA